MQIDSPSGSSFIDGTHPFSFIPSYIQLSAQSRNAQALIAFDPETGASMPLIFRKSRGFRTLTCLHVPHTSNGIRLDPEAESLFLEHFIHTAKYDFQAHRITPPENWCLFNSSPLSAVSCPFASYIVDLTKDEDDLWKNLHSKHRNAIRNAYKKEIRIDAGDHVLDLCHEIYASTMRRNGFGPHSYTYFKSLFKQLPENVLPLVASRDGEPKSSALLMYSREAAYYIYGGTVDNGADAGANTLLHYHAMLSLKKKGVLRYNFVGARVNVELTDRQAGIQRFKARFGGELHVGKLWKIDLSPKICYLHDLGRKSWSHARGRKENPDLVDQINSMRPNPMI